MRVKRKSRDRRVYKETGFLFSFSLLSKVGGTGFRASQFLCLLPKIFSERPQTASATSCSATSWQLLPFGTTFDFEGNGIKFLATYGNYKVLYTYNAVQDLYNIRRNTNSVLMLYITFNNLWLQPYGASWGGGGGGGGGGAPPPPPPPPLISYQMD